MFFMIKVFASQEQFVFATDLRKAINFDSPIDSHISSQPAYCENKYQGHCSHSGIRISP